MRVFTNILFEPEHGIAVLIHVAIGIGNVEFGFGEIGSHMKNRLILSDGVLKLAALRVRVAQLEVKSGRLRILSQL